MHNIGMFGQFNLYQTYRQGPCRQAKEKIYPVIIIKASVGGSNVTQKIIREKSKIYKNS
jgi:hypothetical protein